MSLSEQYVAGAILLEGYAINAIDGILNAEDFQIDQCRAIFEAAQQIYKDGGTVDPAAIAETARRNGITLQNEFLLDLMACVPTAASVSDHAYRVAEEARLRRVKALAAQIQMDGTATADELLEKIQKEAGELAQERPETKKAGLMVTSAQDLQAASIPSTVFMITGILPEGTSILSAASKIGKSWMVLDMGLSIAAGVPFMGKAVKQCGVLYLALEDSLGRLQDRMNKILSGGKAPQQFYFATEAPNLDNGLLDALDDHLKQFPETKLVIIDTLQKIRGRALPRESSYEQDYREMGTVKSYMDKKGVSVLFVHHNRKMKDEDDPFNMISGTNGIMGAADTIWAIIKGKRADNEATLHITGRDVQQTDTVITFDKGAWKWKPVGSLELMTAQRERLAYDNNPIVQTIKGLLKEQVEWHGTATDLMGEGRRICKCSIAPTAQKIGYELKRLDALLLDYDGIMHQKSGNGNAGNIHYFSKKISIPDEYEEEDMLPL